MARQDSNPRLPARVYAHRLVFCLLNYLPFIGLESAVGIEPTRLAWKARTLPIELRAQKRRVPGQARLAPGNKPGVGPARLSPGMLR